MLLFCSIIPNADLYRVLSDPFDIYFISFELYEVFKPGSLWKISTTDDYIDDTIINHASMNRAFRRQNGQHSGQSHKNL